MLRKEIMDTLRQTALVLSFLLLIPLIFWVNKMRLPGDLYLFDYLYAGITLDLQLLIAWFAYSIFSREDNDDASEYLKSLPVSRWKMLCIKILPRLAVVWILELILSATTMSKAGLMSYSYSTALMFPVLAMLAGFILGISHRRNPVLIFSLMLLVTYPTLIGPIISYMLFIGKGSPLIALHTSHYTLYRILRTLVIFLPSVLPIALLFPVYKSWDCSSARIRSQRILKRIAVPVVLVVSLWGVVLTSN